MFRGAKSDIGIRQFLSHMSSQQDLYGLSRREFIKQMKMAVGGEAYDFLQGLTASDKVTVEQIYKHMLDRFDNRMPPEKAKSRLQALKVTRSDTLVKLMGRILKLIQQASEAYPLSYRQTYVDYHGPQFLINALPTLARNFAMQKLVQLQQRCQTPIPSLADFEEELTQHSQFINEDIAENATAHRAVGSLYATHQSETGMDYYDPQPEGQRSQIHDQGRNYNRRRPGPPGKRSSWQRQTGEESQDGPWDQDWE